MDPAILKALLYMRENADALLVGFEYGYASAVLNVSFITTLLTYCTSVDECVHALNESGLTAESIFVSGALEHAYDEKKFACAEVLIKWETLDQSSKEDIMTHIINRNDYEAAKHFIGASGYTMRNADTLPRNAFKEKKWMKLFMEDADGMHLLFKPMHFAWSSFSETFNWRIDYGQMTIPDIYVAILSVEWTILGYLNAIHPEKHELLQYVYQLQFLSSLVIILALRQFSALEWRGRDGNKKMPINKLPIEMFRLIGAMLI